MTSEVETDQAEVELRTETLRHRAGEIAVETWMQDLDVASASTSFARGDLRRRDGRPFSVIMLTAAMDLFVVPIASFRLLYGLLIMGHSRRQILWLGVTAHPTAEWIANQLTQAYGWQHTALSDPRPGCLLRRCVHLPPSISRHSRSPDIPAITLAEWLYGMFGWLDRRECLDHVVVLGEQHLRHMLSWYLDYHNATRTHLSLDKDTPIHRTLQAVGCIQTRPILGGLDHQYTRI